MEKTKYVLNAKQSIIFGNPFATSGGASFDLTETESNDKISNDSVLCFTTAVRDHDTPIVGLGELSTKRGISVEESCEKGNDESLRTPEWIRKWFQSG